MHRRLLPGFRPVVKEGSDICAFSGKACEDECYGTLALGRLKGMHIPEAVSMQASARVELFNSLDFRPHLNDDTGVRFEDLTGCISYTTGTCMGETMCMSRQTEWRTLPRPRYVLDNTMMMLWAASPQKMHSFERSCYLCMTAVCPELEAGCGYLALSGHKLDKDLPHPGEGSKKETVAMTKWMERLLETPDFWPGSAITRDLPLGEPAYPRTTAA